MRQYTTPVVQLRIDGHTVSGDVYVTFANKARNVTLTISNPTVTSTGSLRANGTRRRSPTSDGMRTLSRRSWND